MDVNERLDRALDQLARETEVPPEDPARAAALLAAFGAAAQPAASVRRRDYWWMGALATAAAVLVATGLGWPAIGRHDPSSQRADSHSRASPRGVQPPSPGEFVIVPGAASLPRLESGTLVRMELPVSVLPSLGMTPPARGHATEVTADVIVGQDGLPRAIRLVE